LRFLLAAARPPPALPPPPPPPPGAAADDFSPPGAAAPAAAPSSACEDAMDNVLAAVEQAFDEETSIVTQDIARIGSQLKKRKRTQV
jgi:hypothetical protein